MTSNNIARHAGPGCFAATLLQMVLVKVQAERLPSSAEKLQASPRVNVKTTVKGSGRTMEALFDVSIRVPSAEEPICSLDYTMRGVFEVEPSPTTEAECMRTASALATSIAWPYLRGYAETIFQQMGIFGPVPLPLSMSAETVLQKLDTARKPD